MRIEVFSDTVCPWCYVGLMRLGRALAQRPALKVQLRWLPFELNPLLAEAGEERAQYMQRRFGDVNRFAEGQQQLQQIGAGLGIDFRFDLQRWIPNTRRSHLLLAWAESLGGERQTLLKKAILEAYFTRGLDIGSVEILTQLAGQCGLDVGAACAAMGDPRWRAEVLELEQQARQWNISGVPTFIFERREAFSGAQEEAVILQFIDRMPEAA